MIRMLVGSDRRDLPPLTPNLVPLGNQGVLWTPSTRPRRPNEEEIAPIVSGFADIRVFGNLVGIRHHGPPDPRKQARSIDDSLVLSERLEKGSRENRMP